MNFSIDLSGLRAIAQSATQTSPWRVEVDERDRTVVLDADEMWVADCGCAPKDGAHIAAFHPERVLALLDYIQQLEREARINRDEILRLDLALAKERAKVADVAQTQVA